MANKKKTEEKKCTTCKFYDGINCIHASNIGIRIKYRKESNFYVESAEKLEKDCKNFKENDV